MSKETVLNVSKKEIHYLLERLTLDCLDETEKVILKHFEFLRVLRDLPDFTHPPQKEATANNVPLVDTEVITKEITETKPEISNETYIEKEEKVSSEEKSKESDHPFKEKLYTFERKIRGGFFADLDNGYFIPEKMVRDIGLEHGDKVRIVNHSMFEDTKRYRFEIVEKGPGISPKERVEVQFCIVEKDYGEIIVRETLQGNIKVNEVPNPFILKANDVADLQVKPGDIIDIAYYENKPNETVRIIWKHDIEELEQPRTRNEHITKKQVPIDTTKSVKYDKYPLNKDIFVNKKILLVGGISRESDYREAFEMLGTEFTLTEGNDERARLTSMIKKADGVVVIIQEAKHMASENTIESCKKHNIPFQITKSNGIQSILLAAQQVLEKSSSTASQVASNNV